MNWMHVETALGTFTLIASGGAVVRLGLPGTPLDLLLEGRPGPDDEDSGLQNVHPPEGLDGLDGQDALPVLQAAAIQLREYGQGIRTELDFPVRMEGTDFQKAVWNALRSIPAGRTATYKEVAEAIGRPGAQRAVGQANRANPLPLIVPCHRVVPSGGGLGGYQGLDAEGTLKARFLEIESARLRA